MKAYAVVLKRPGRPDTITATRDVLGTTMDIYPTKEDAHLTLLARRGDPRVHLVQVEITEVIE